LAALIIFLIFELFETDVKAKWKLISPFWLLGRDLPFVRAPNRTPGFSQAFLMLGSMPPYW
jgi:hypothetical protein